ncbi:MAG: hypothetical protein D3903_11655 [Candidatus Electrothrix sp. GM3_4]|nr:hypothetical protein [Candidatus Electrothrix sp. GM3_4]
MNVSLVYLRVMAIFLIVNSHLSELYPVSSMSFGGHLGNTIFYFISGLGLSISYSRSPISTSAWFRKRITKILIPVLLFLFILNFGNWNVFLQVVLNNLIWHDLKQMTYFLPVLLFLYLIFLPTQKMNNKTIVSFIIIIFILSSLAFFVKVCSIEQVPSNLPSSSIFFPLNALLAFCMGILLARESESVMIITVKQIHPFFFLLGIIASQGLHQLFVYVGGWYITINFYLNFITLLSLYMLFSSFKYELSSRFVPILNIIASSSLAIYLVHFRYIHIVDDLNVEFPYNVAQVYLYTIIFAYSLTRLSDYILNYFLMTTKNRFQSHFS